MQTLLSGSHASCSARATPIAWFCIYIVRNSQAVENALPYIQSLCDYADTLFVALESYVLPGVAFLAWS